MKYWIASGASGAARILARFLPLFASESWMNRTFGLEGYCLPSPQEKMKSPLVPGTASVTRLSHVGHSAYLPSFVWPLLNTRDFSALTAVKMAVWFAALEGRASGTFCPKSVQAPL